MNSSPLHARTLTGLFLCRKPQLLLFHESVLLSCPDHAVLFWSFPTSGSYNLSISTSEMAHWALVAGDGWVDIDAASVTAHATVFILCALATCEFLHQPWFAAQKASSESESLTGTGACQG